MAKERDKSVTSLIMVSQNEKSNRRLIISINLYFIINRFILVDFLNTLGRKARGRRIDNHRENDICFEPNCTCTFFLTKFNFGQLDSFDKKVVTCKEYWCRLCEIIHC